jgi:hypothetical protein
MEAFFISNAAIDLFKMYEEFSEQLYQVIVEYNSQVKDFEHQVAKLEEENQKMREVM